MSVAERVIPSRRSAKAGGCPDEGHLGTATTPTPTLPTTWLFRQMAVRTGLSASTLSTSLGTRSRPPSVEVVDAGVVALWAVPGDPQVTP